MTTRRNFLQMAAAAAVSLVAIPKLAIPAREQDGQKPTVGVDLCPIGNEKTVAHVTAGERMYAGDMVAYDVTTDSVWRTPQHFKSRCVPLGVAMHFAKRGEFVSVRMG